MKSKLFGCSFIAVFFLIAPLIPHAISQSQNSSAPLTDVCRAGWSRYTCGVQVRVCVSPDVENHFNLADSVRWSVEGCGKTPTRKVVPEAWTHATPEEVGYLSAARRWAGYDFHIRVVNFDSSAIRNGDLEGAIQNLHIAHEGYEGDTDRFNEGRAKYRPSGDQALESYGIPLPVPKTPATEVCPATWSRFSCRFVRLCVSPSVAAKYDLASSKQFGSANCKEDTRSVSAANTRLSPEEVGLAAGAMIVGPRYLRAVKIDSSDVFEGDIEEAIQRLVLVPIPPEALMEYDRGYTKGQAEFEAYLAKNKQREAGRPQ